MADGCIIVSCFVCSKPAVRRRVFCPYCQVWAHLSCANKKQCCDSYNITSTADIDDDDGPVKNLVASINTLSSTVSDMKKVISELINENKKLRQEIEELKSTKRTTAIVNSRDDLNMDAKTAKRIRRDNNIIIRGTAEQKGKLIKSESTSSDTSPPSQPEHPTKKFYSQHLKYVVITFLVLITLGVVTTVIVLSVKSDPEEPTFNPNTNHDDVDDGDDVLKPAGPGLIINKKKWGGRPALNWTKPLSHPIPYVIISHTVTPQCKDFDACSRRVQSIQTYHVGGGKSPDIGYNFLIGGDGNAYVGRGWDIQNFHKNNSLGISFIGNYVYDYLTSNMIDVTKKLLDEGVKSGKISKTYVLVAHNQTYATESPGSHVYEVIKNWPHFSPERLL